MCVRLEEMPDASGMDLSIFIFDECEEVWLRLWLDLDLESQDSDVVLDFVTTSLEASLV